MGAKTAHSIVDLESGNTQDHHRQQCQRRLGAFTLKK
uniref:Uncharacterized protein n=1 Tax=Arundo donax TaxID=35708 RepID=A0A0A8ZCB3_ARUDO